MIKVLFYNWDADTIDIEKELGIEREIEKLLTEKIAGIRFEATDNEADLENNWIYWFSGVDEVKAAGEIFVFLSSVMGNSGIKFDISVEQW